MGFIRHKRPLLPASLSPEREQREEDSISFTSQIGYGPLVQVSGTTTMGKEEALALVTRRDLTERDILVCNAVLEREPENPVDAGAVAVLVDGGRIGYLPSAVAHEYPLSDGGAQTVPLQLFTAPTSKGLRVEAWVWLAAGEAEWSYSAESRPPMTPEEKRISRARHSQAMVDAALNEGGARAAQFQAGMIDGLHYLELIEPIKELKREGRLEEALALCYRAIQGAENADNYGGPPPPWYTEQAAIIHRKLGQRTEEIAVLRRWLAQSPAEFRERSAVMERLRKLEP